MAPPFPRSAPSNAFLSAVPIPLYSLRTRLLLSLLDFSLSWFTILRIMVIELRGNAVSAHKGGTHTVANEERTDRITEHADELRVQRTEEELRVQRTEEEL